MFLLSLSAAAIFMTQASQPVRMETRTLPDGVEVLVVGSSETPVGASYKLEVASGTNRSSQSGNVQLRPGKAVTLVRQRLGGSMAADWTARLQVDLQDGQSYSDLRSSR